jgi:hypothetical protein
MTQSKKATNGPDGLTWSTIGKAILPTVAILLTVFGVGFAHWVQVAVMDEKINTHIVLDKERDERVEARVHAIELSVAAMQGGE